MEGSKRLVLEWGPILSLNLLGQLQYIKMPEGGSINNYIKRAHELKNKLKSLGETILDKQVNLLVLNGLLRSYKNMIQTLSHTRRKPHLK
jgi:hypothetical protein